MNWEAIGAVGQLVSALALMLVMLQIRQAREEVERNARHARTEGTRSLMLTQASQPELAAAMERLWVHESGAPQPYIAYAMTVGLTEAQARQAYSMAWATWYNFDSSVGNVRHLSRGARSEVDGNIRAIFGAQTPQAKWYALMKDGLNPDTVRYIDNLLAQPG